MATLALNAGEWFRRGRLLIFCAPENTGSILAHRSSSSTYRRVQFCATTSTGAKLKIAASKAPKFTPGSAFKAAVDPKAARRKADKAAAGKAAVPAKKPAAQQAVAKKAATKKAGKAG